MRYRKVPVLLWADASFMDLTDDAKLLRLFIMTHPTMSSVGAMRATVEGLAAELRWTSKRCRVAFRELASKGMILFDANSCLVVLPDFLDYNPPENPNVVKGWLKALEVIPNCTLKDRVYAYVREALKGMPESFRKALDTLPEPFLKGIPNQEQEQEQEQDRQSGSNAEVDADEHPLVEVQDLEFDQLWGIYPARDGKKLDRAGTFRKWRALSAADRALVIQAVRHYADSSMVKKGIGIKDPARWLKNGKGDESWRDWIEPEERTPKTNGVLAHVGFNTKDYKSGSW